VVMLAYSSRETTFTNWEQAKAKEWNPLGPRRSESTLEQYLQDNVPTKYGGCGNVFAVKHETKKFAYEVTTSTGKTSTQIVNKGSEPLNLDRGKNYSCILCV